MPIVGQFGSLAGFGMFPGGALESIATVTVGGGGASQIDFTSIPQTYANLHIRIVCPFIAQDGGIYAYWNGSTTASEYSWHLLAGLGSGVSAYGATNWGNTTIAYDHNRSYNASYLKVAVVDVIDYASTTKAKNIRIFSGFDTNTAGVVSIESGGWYNTSAITSITFKYQGNAGGYGFKNFAQHTQIALYGVKAP